MKRITKISAQKNKGRYNLFLDEEYFCGLTEDTILQFGLKKGMLLDDDILLTLEENEKKNQCFNESLKLLGRQSYFKKTLKDKLKQKGYGEEEINFTISKLQDLGYINDDSLTTSYIKDKKRFSQKGSVYISQMLRTKGVDLGQIEQSLSKHYSLEEEIASCEAVAIKKLESYKRKETDSYKLKGKLYLFLAQRGFRKEAIEAVIKELFRE